MEFEQTIKDMKFFFENVENALKQANSELSKMNMEQSDILHYIENNKLNAGGYSKTGKLLKDLRTKRRLVKNKIEKLEEMQKLAKKYNNKLIVGDLMQILKALSELSKKQENPIYHNRTNIIEEQINNFDK